MEEQKPSEQRTYNKAPNGDEYVFGRAGYQASARLNLQHFYYKTHSDYLLHPNIDLNKTDLRVADVGTGTGIWIFDLARTVPSSVQFDGFDVSADQFPCLESLPANVNLDQMDALAPLPDHLIERYDVVHIRLFCTVVRGNDASALVANLTRMLKPGGYLQWVENDTIAQSVCLLKPGASTEALGSFLSYMRSAQDRLSKTDWVKNLDSTFEQAGLVDTQLDRFTTRPEFGRMHDDTLFWTVEDYSYNFLDRMPETRDAGQGEYARKLVAEAYKDSVNGAYLSSDFVVVTGRKPLLHG